MKRPAPSDAETGRYRTGYLKLRSVLYDRNTGLPAFPVLFDRLRNLLDERRELGVLHVEIANLEMVESLYGWQVFDRIVARAAGILRKSLGHQLPEGALLALNGVAGDRFVVFVPEQKEGKPPDGAFLTRTGRTLCRKLEQAFDGEDFKGLSPKLCFRSGCALLSQNPFYRFERCVYSAVEQARASHHRRERRRELSWGEELRAIIQSASVDTLFQPVVELGTRSVLGYEAFVRGPADTLFETPRAMFALSTRVGVSAELDRMCCEAALRAFVKLAGKGKIFLNLLPGSLDDEEWRRGRFLSLLTTLVLEPADLVLEFSERGADSDPESFVASLKRYKEEGYALALDDVGTGRAGLALIEQVEPDFLKLDLSLVRDIHKNLIQQELLLTLTRLAARIGAAVIAEGVETEAEAAALADGGARYAQGYLFALPAASWEGKGKPGTRRRKDS